MIPAINCDFWNQSRYLLNVPCTYEVKLIRPIARFRVILFYLVLWTRSWIKSCKFDWVCGQFWLCRDFPQWESMSNWLQADELGLRLKCSSLPICIQTWNWLQEKFRKLYIQQNHIIRCDMLRHRKDNQSNKNGFRSFHPSGWKQATVILIKINHI